jgi:DedD protein
MPLPFFRPKADPRDSGRARKPSEGLGDEATIAAARTQARRRLIGALVLLVVGVIGFPLLFETTPRPLPQDTPIIVAEGALTRPAAPPMPAEVPATRPLPVLPADAGVEPVASAQAAVAPATSKPAPAAVLPPTVSPTAPPAAPPAAKPAPKPAPAAPAASAVAGRWVVQVGAYNDVERMRAARARLQKMGLASYTQDVDTASGKRTRVRVGPFKSRQEADAVAARVKAAGLQAAVLTL